MTTTVEAPATNPHQPTRTENALTCAAPDCGYAMHVYAVRSVDTASHEAFWLRLFESSHSGQYDVGRAPDISVDWEISACCSVCEDGIGKVVTNDSETVTCEECDTVWSMDGTNGERADADA